MTTGAGNYALGCLAALVAAAAVVGAAILSILGSDNFELSIGLPVVIMLVLLGYSVLGLLSSTEPRPRAVAWGIAGGTIAAGMLVLMWFGSL